MEEFLKSGKVKAMLATEMKTRADNWQIGQELHCETYIPSPARLALVLENGWRVVKVELAPSLDQLGLVYLVTLKSDSRLQSHRLILPRNAQFEKILDENLRLDTSAKTSQPGEECLPAM
jgi:hypothetical protein